MHEIILCKLGEVVLKGLNRRSFEMKLMSNIRRRTQRFGKWKIYSRPAPWRTSWTSGAPTV